MGHHQELKRRLATEAAQQLRQEKTGWVTTPQKGGRWEEPQSESSVAAEEDGLLMENEDQ